MTDEEVEKIIKSNMNLQMNLAGIRADFEEKLQRTWVGLDSEEIRKAKHHMVEGAYQYSFKQGAEWAEAKLKEKNT